MTGIAAKTGAALLGVTHPHASGRTRALIEKSIPILGAWDDDPVIEPFTKKFEIPNRPLDAILNDRDVNIVLIHSKSHSMVSLASAALRAGKAVPVGLFGAKHRFQLPGLRKRLSTLLNWRRLVTCITSAEKWRAWSLQPVANSQSRSQRLTPATFSN